MKKKQKKKTYRKKKTASRRSFSLRLTRLLEIILVAALIVLGRQLFLPTLLQSRSFQPAVLQQAVDGDTLYAYVDGQQTKIRLIGINTPESVAFDASLNTAEGQDASDYLTALLPPGTPIYLQYDKGRTDRYGRTLAYVWLKADADPASFEDFRSYCLNAVILQNTWCETMFYSPNYLYREWLLALEAEK